MYPKQELKLTIKRMEDEISEDDEQEIQIQTLISNTAIQHTLKQIWSALLVCCYGNSSIKKYKDDNDVTLVPIKLANY